MKKDFIDEIEKKVDEICNLLLGVEGSDDDFLMAISTHFVQRLFLILFKKRGTKERIELYENSCIVVAIDFFKHLLESAKRTENDTFITVILKGREKLVKDFCNALSREVEQYYNENSGGKKIESYNEGVL